MAKKRIRFGLSGTGWRADFFLGLARRMPDLFEVVALTSRNPDTARQAGEHWGVPAVAGVEEIARLEPDFVVVSVARIATPGAIAAAVALGLPVLAETPPATDLAAMRDLWNGLADPGLVQVAEQYPYLPKLQAYRALVESGALGAVSSAQLSWTHGYHAVAMLRSLLGVGFDPVEVSAGSFVAPIIQSFSKGGWPDEQTETEIEVTQTIATLDFGGRMGLYDFTDDQWFHPLMGRRLTVRGTRGEIIDDQVTRLVDPRTPVREVLARRVTGVDGNLEGLDFDTLSLTGEVLYRNPFPGARLSDEEIAIASVLERMGEWTRGSAEAPYPLAQASQDHAIALAIEESAASGLRVRVADEPWVPAAS